MNPIYEYIAAFFIMTLIVGYSLYSLNTMSSSQLNIAHEEQLQPEASRLLDKILLTTGYPVNWGSNISILNETDLRDFGLSFQSLDPYRVNLNNLMRLVNAVGNMENPLYLNPTVMGNLTGIYENNSWRYGFRLLIKSALDIKITNGTSELGIPTNFTADVTNFFGEYAANAEIKATYFCVYSTNENKTSFDYFVYENANITNWQGRALLDFAQNITMTDKQLINKVEGWCLLVTANYYGIQSQQILVSDEVPTLALMIQGQYLIAQFVEDVEFPMGAHQLRLTAIEFTTNHQVILNPIENVTGKQPEKIINRGKYNYSVYQLEDQPTEDVIFAGLIVKKTGKLWFVLASQPRVPEAIDYRSHAFEYAGVSSDTFARLIRISRNSYYAELTLWRMSE